MILKAEANLVPMGPRSPLRFGRCRTDVPRTSCNPSSARLRSLWGRRPWFKVSPPARSARGMGSPRTSLALSSARLRLLRGRRPWVQGLRFASVVAEQTSPGRLAVSAPLRSAHSRHPPDVLRPIFRKVPVVAGAGSL